MTAPRVTAQGKQVLHKGTHYADACDDAAADAIVTALNAGWQPIEMAPRDGKEGPGPEFLAAEYILFGQWNMSVVRFVHGVLCHAWDHAPVKPTEFEPTHWRPLPEAPTPSPAATREGGE